MTRYEKCDEEMHERARAVLEAHHHRLLEAGVSICCVFAYATKDEDGEPKGPAIKHHGIAATALARIVNLRDRAKGMSDAEILIDGDEWGHLSTEEQDAILDHELTHFEPKLSPKTGDIQFDDCERPKLRMRHHDHEFGWFDEVAERHGEHSAEIRQARALLGTKGQLYFGFAAPAKKGRAA